MNANGLGDIGPEILLLLVPLLVLQIVLMVLAIADLLRDDRRVRGGNKAIWAVVIVLVNLLGPIIYLMVGREEGVPDAPTAGPGAMPGWGSPAGPEMTATSPAPAATPGPAATATTAPAAGAAEANAVMPIASRAALLPEDAPPAIRTIGLTKRYRGSNGVLALDHLSMMVPQGSVFGLLGPNGAGKTTCLRLLAGLTRPTDGSAEIAGLAVPGQVMDARRRLGYLEQDPRAYGWLTGREQVAMLGRLHGLDGSRLDDAVTAALARVGLSDAADRRIGAYSGGMRQRLGVAGALVHRPPIVVLDEPVSALDPEGRRDVLGLIADLRGESTVLFSTHVLADVERICDRVGILDHGRLVVEGPLTELLERYALPVYRLEAEPGQAATLEALAARLQDRPWVTGAAAEHGLLTIAVGDPAVAARELLPIVATSGVSLVSLARARPTLEDVFLRLTGEDPEVAA